MNSSYKHQEYVTSKHQVRRFSLCFLVYSFTFQERTFQYFTSTIQTMNCASFLTGQVSIL